MVLVAALVGGLLDFFISYGFWLVVFLGANFVVVRDLSLPARYHRVHPYAFYIALAAVFFNFARVLSR